MPELPEVETIKDELRPYVIGHRISAITLCWERIVRQPAGDEFCSSLIGQEISGLSRRGKYLIFRLNSGRALVAHLKMSGSLLVSQNSSEPSKYTRAILQLDNGVNILFRDPRKFGAMWLVSDASSVVGKLGPEPLEPDFTPQLLAKLLAKRKAPIKAILCDQNVIAGIGNMYADEALFLARIHPQRPAGSLCPAEIEHLYRAIQQVLREGIGNKGASIVNYLRPDGQPGTAHDHFQVAHRGGKPCPVCGTPIARITVRNRGTYFCPRCQPE